MNHALNIVKKAIEQAEDGDPVARAWLADRLEGKAIGREERGAAGEFDGVKVLHAIDQEAV